MSGVEHRTVGDDEAGQRIDRWFKKHFPDLTYGRLSKLLRTGQIRLDGHRVKPGDRIEAGQDIRIPPIGEAPPRPKTGRSQGPELSGEDRARARDMLIYQDNDILVLNKEPGLPTQGGTGHTMHVDAMLEVFAPHGSPRPRLVHRLDKDTSGVLVLARSAEAARLLTRSFRSREVEKIYWALVMGRPAEPQGRIDLAIEKLPGKGGEKMVPSKTGKRATTFYQVIDSVAKKASWLAMKPVTGRTHQLRVHMAAIGHPIVGDGKYGGKEAFLTGGISKKLHLHARSISLPGIGGKPFHIEAALPRHMRESWEFLGLDEDAAALGEAALREAG